MGTTNFCSIIVQDIKRLLGFFWEAKVGKGSLDEGKGGEREPSLDVLRSMLFGRTMNILRGWRARYRREVSLES